MAERLLITKLKRIDQTRAELYGKGHQFRDLVLFDLSDLAAVNIDGAALPIGIEVPCRFWANWEYSDRVNRVGKRYRDVIALEDTTALATTTSTDTSAALIELRRISALLTALVEAQGLTVPAMVTEPAPQNGDSELDQHFPRYGDGSALGDKPAEVEAYQEHLAAVGCPPATLEALRSWTLARRKGATSEKK